MVMEGGIGGTPALLVPVLVWTHGELSLIHISEPTRLLSI